MVEGRHGNRWLEQPLKGCILSHMQEAESTVGMMSDFWKLKEPGIHLLRQGPHLLIIPEQYCQSGLSA